MSMAAVPSRASASTTVRAAVVVAVGLILGLLLAVSPASAAPHGPAAPSGAPTLAPGMNGHFLRSGVPLYAAPTDTRPVLYSAGGDQFAALCYRGDVAVRMRILYGGHPMWSPADGLVLHVSGIRRCGFWS